MRRMFSKKQLEELIGEYAPEVSPEDIQAMFDEGEVSLAGKYVRIMAAPESTTLTDEQIEMIKEGVFVNGTIPTENVVNPIIFPCVEDNENFRGFFIGKRGASYTFGAYYITKSTKRLAMAYHSEINNLGSIVKLNGFPYPIAATQNNVSSGDTITLNSELDRAIKGHKEVEINGHRCRFESEETSGSTTYVIYSSFGEVSATGKLTANIISYNKDNREISFNQMTFTPDA